MILLSPEEKIQRIQEELEIADRNQHEHSLDETVTAISFVRAVKRILRDDCYTQPDRRK